MFFVLIQGSFLHAVSFLFLASRSRSAMQINLALVYHVVVQLFNNIKYRFLSLGFPIPRILALEKLGAVFNQISTPLKYTPRKFAIDAESSSLVIIETDHNSLTESAKQDRKQKIAEVCFFK